MTITTKYYDSTFIEVPTLTDAVAANGWVYKTDDATGQTTRAKAAAATMETYLSIEVMTKQTGDFTATAGVGRELIHPIDLSGQAAVSETVITAPTPAKDAVFTISDPTNTITATRIARIDPGAGISIDGMLPGDSAIMNNPDGRDGLSYTFIGIDSTTWKLRTNENE